MSVAEPSQQQLLSVPLEGENSKKKRPRSPRKRAPVAPKKKKQPSHKDNVQSHDKDGVSCDPPKDYLEPKGKRKKSLERPVSPRKEQYSSLLDEMVGKGDMVLLDSITEEAIMENLEKRYTAEEIYVSL